MKLFSIFSSANQFSDTLNHSSSIRRSAKFHTHGNSLVNQFMYIILVFIILDMTRDDKSELNGRKNYPI